MKSKDIEKMIRWAVDTDGYQFAEEIYGSKEPDEYTRGKFKDMQTDFIRWIAGLDYKNRERLAKIITLKNKKEVDDGWILDTVMKDGKIVKQGEIDIQ